jgi:hypothetical protein
VEGYFAAGVSGGGCYCYGVVSSGLKRSVWRSTTALGGMELWR